MLLSVENGQGNGRLMYRREEVRVLLLHPAVDQQQGLLLPRPVVDQQCHRNDQKLSSLSDVHCFVGGHFLHAVDQVNQAHVLSDKVNPERIGKKIQNADGSFYVKFND